MRMRIKHITISKFKGISDMSIDLDDRTSIKSQNGQGKTTIATAVFWLFLDKDYDLNSNPAIRPIGTEECLPEVSLTLDIDGKEIVATKRQKQTKRESKDGTVKVALSNAYEINSVSKTERDFRLYFEELGFDFENALSLMHPAYFTSQTEKGGRVMRDVLFKMTSEHSDVDIADMSDETSAVADLLRKGYALDEIEAMNRATRTKADKEQSAIPNQIIGMEKAKVECDVAAISKEKQDIESQIAAAENELNTSSGKEELEKLEQDKFTIQRKLNEKKRELLQAFYDEKNELDAEYHKCISDASKIDADIRIARCDLEKTQSEIARIQQEKDNLAKMYRAADKATFSGVLDWDERKWIKPSDVCSMCGQKLPKEESARIINEFETRKSAAKKQAETNLDRERSAFLEQKSQHMKDIEDQGFQAKKKLEQLSNDIKELRRKIKELDEKEGEIELLQESYRLKLDQYKEEPTDFSDETYKELAAKLEELSASIKQVKQNVIDVSDQESRIEELKQQLSGLDTKLAQAKHNADIDNDIAKLRDKQREYEQQKANAERILYQLDILSRKKNELLTDEINSHFNVVKWQLWDFQKNGNYKEICVPIIDGFRFGESTNTGRQILAELDICDCIQRFFNIRVPIILDGAESLNEWNIPVVDTQLITMSVSDDKELVVTKE